MPCSSSNGFRIQELDGATAGEPDWLDAIGKLRVDVWQAETSMDERLFSDGRWLDRLDEVARHWVAFDAAGLAGAGRLTVHDTLEAHPDGAFLIDAGRSVPVPAANISKLVVHRRARRSGIGSALIRVRVDAARDMGAKSILVTATDATVGPLQTLGFEDSGIRVPSVTRPGFVFRCFQLVF